MGPSASSCQRPLHSRMRKKAKTEAEAGVRTASIRPVVNASEFRRLTTTQTQGTETDAGSKDIRFAISSSHLSWIMIMLLLLQYYLSYFILVPNRFVCRQSLTLIRCRPRVWFAKAVGEIHCDCRPWSKGTTRSSSRGFDRFRPWADTRLSVPPRSWVGIG